MDHQQKERLKISKFEYDFRNNFQIGIQFYNDGFDYLTVRDRPVPEKLGWLFSQKINIIKESLFDISFIEKTKDKTYEAFKTQFFEGLKSGDKNEVIPKSKSAKYIGFLFAKLRTEYGEIIIHFCIDHQDSINNIDCPSLINKTFRAILQENTEYQEITRL